MGFAGSLEIVLISIPAQYKHRTTSQSHSPAVTVQRSENLVVKFAPLMASHVTVRYSKDSGIDSVSEETLHNDESEVQLGHLELFQCLSGYVSGFCSALFAFGRHLESILVLSFLKQ